MVQLVSYLYLVTALASIIEPSRIIVRYVTNRSIINEIHRYYGS